MSDIKGQHPHAMWLDEIAAAIGDDAKLLHVTTTLAEGDVIEEAFAETDREPPCYCKHIVCAPHPVVGKIVARVAGSYCPVHNPPPKAWADADSFPFVDMIKAVEDFKQHYIDNMNNPPPRQLITERQLQNVKAGRAWWDNGDK